MDHERCEKCGLVQKVSVAEAADLAMKIISDAEERGRLAGIAEGRAAERADVVAWFYDDRRWLDDMRWSTLRAHHRDAIRNDIERGDHVGAAGKVKP
jgi:hypothetical protein